MSGTDPDPPPSAELPETVLESSELPETLAPPEDGPAGLPSRLGGFEIERELARGGMGIVYVARSPTLKRRVAIKVLLSGGLATPEAVERFKREGQAAARLKHPAVVGVHEVGEDAGRHFIVMDLIDGESLKQRLVRSGPLPPRAAAEVAETLARALAHAHQEGILHRDMKPANVLLDRHDQPLLTDFGLAKVVEADGEGPTRTGQLMGTPAYMPPEQAQGDAGRVDVRADVYSLGATLYHMLCGRPPFRAPTTIQLIHQVISKEPISLRRLRPALDRDLETICLRCLEKSPDSRYASASALADDLRRYLDHQPILARPAGLFERVHKWTRRNRGLSRVIAVASVTVALVTALSAAWIIDARATTRAQQADRGRRAEEEQSRQRTEVLDWLKQAEDGDLSHSEARRAAVLGILRYASPQTTALLSERLNQLADRVGGVTEEMLLSAEHPDDSERAAGESDLDGLPAALDVRRHTPAGVPLPDSATQSIHDAGERLLRREHRRLTNAARALRTVPSLRQILASAQARALRVGGVDQAKLICEALGQIEPTFGSREALAYFLSLTEDEQLAVSAGTALCRMATPRAAELALVSCHRFGYSGVYARGVRRALREYAIQLPVDDEATPRALLQRARLLATLGELAAAMADLERVLRLSPDDIQALRLRANVHTQGGQLAAARADLDRIIQLAPGYAKGWYNRGGIRKKQGDLEGALSDYDRSIAVDPLDAHCYTNRAGVRLQVDDLDGAQADIERALAITSEVAEAWGIRGFLRQRREDLAGAQSDLERALELDPELVWVWIHLSEVLEAQGLEAKAFQAVRRAVTVDSADPEAIAQRGRLQRRRGDLSSALADFDQAVSLAPDEPRYLFGRGELRGLLGDSQGSCDDFGKALRLAPDDPALWLGRAIARKQLGDLEGARSDCDAALERDPSMWDAWSERGLIREALGELPGALADHLEAVRLAPESATCWCNLGTGHQSLGQWEQAIEAYSRAIGLDPQLALAWSNRGSTKEAMGQLPEAQADYDRALQLDPTFSGTWFNRGNVRKLLGDLEGAISDYDRALQLQPELIDAWINRANSHLASEDLEQAQSDYARAVELAPRDPMIRRNRARVFHRAGDAAAALSELEEACRLAPDDPRGWFDRGNVRGASGDLEGARADFSRVIELDPSHVEAYLSRGLAWKFSGDQAAALADYTLAIEADPSSGKARYYRATGRADAGDLRGAIDDFAALLELDPSFVDGWRLRGELAAKAGDVQTAIADLERFLRLAPEAPEVAKTRALVERLRKPAEAPATND